MAIDPHQLQRQVKALMEQNKSLRDEAARLYLPPPGPRNPSQVEARLPAGWEQRQTSKGEFYFFDYNTQTSTWVDPRRQRYI